MSSLAANSSAPSWRSFTFFETVPVKDIHDPDATPEVFKSTPEISVIIRSSLGVLVADIHGSVHLLDRHFESVMSWVAHVGGRVTHMIERQGLLITLGEENSVHAPLIKIWDLKIQDKKTSGPHLLRSSKVQVSNKPHPVSTVAVSATLSHLAIGFTDGSVLLYRYLDQSLASSGSLSTLPKPRVIHENPTEPITGLGFKEPNEDHANLSLFIVTTNRVLLFHAAGRGSGGTPTVIDEVGAGLGCATMDSQSNNMIVAREEAIYVCGTDGRGPSYAYEGTKSSIYTHETYLVIVSPPFIPRSSSASATVRNFVARTLNAQESDITKVTVFDPENKLVAHSGTIRNGVRDVISAWGELYVLTNDGELSHLKEFPTSTKLSTIYSRGLYGLALSLAQTQKLDDASIADIHRQYGDEKYKKGDWDGAMQQYVKTIGHLQPSYVIRKFLDAQRINNLVTYLQELHAMGLANSDHTTLLLNTYTKLKDVARLDSFIKTSSNNASSAAHDELPFDLDTAIRVCRQAGYFSHASYLAKKYDRHEDYLRIQIEDVGDYKDALAYLRVLGSAAAESNLARYGRAMLENLPDETTQLLIDLCTTGTGPPPPQVDPDEIPLPPSATRTTAPSYLSYLALNRNSVVAQSETATIVAPSISTVRAGAVEDEEAEEESTPSSPPLTATSSRIATGRPVQVQPPPAKKLSPRIYFAHFVDHLNQFVVFLESVAERRWNQTVDSTEGATSEPELEEKRDQVAVWNTLLELYLTLPASDKNNWKDKALRVLKSDVLPYESTHALMLCSSFGYTQGLVLLWERMGMYEDVLRFWMEKHKEGDAEASSEVVKHLKSYGPNRPGLYPLVLRFLTSTSELLTRHLTDVQSVLEHINKENIMTPIGVIQVLSRNNVASVGLVKEWLMNRIREARSEIQTDQEWINSYRLETAAKLKLVDELSDPEKPKVFHVTRCSSCGGNMDLPSVHFMCNHSYHQRCLADQTSECPTCAREYSVIREIRRNNERLADQHDVFVSEVQTNGFKAVADAFGRGFLNYSRLEDVT